MSAGGKGGPGGLRRRDTVRDEDLRGRTGSAGRVREEGPRGGQGRRGTVRGAEPQSVWPLGGGADPRSRDGAELRDPGDGRCRSGSGAQPPGQDPLSQTLPWGHLRSSGSSRVPSPSRGLLERGPAAAGSAAGWSRFTAVGRLWVRGPILLPREPWWRVAAAGPGQRCGEGRLWPARRGSSAHRAAMGTGAGAGSHRLVVPRGRGGGALLSPEPYRSQKTGRRQHRAAGAVTLHPRRRARVGGASSRTDTTTPRLGCASLSGLWPLGPCLGSRCCG